MAAKNQLVVKAKKGEVVLAANWLEGSMWRGACIVAKKSDFKKHAHLFIDKFTYHIK